MINTGSNSSNNGAEKVTANDEKIETGKFTIILNSEHLSVGNILKVIVLLMLSLFIYTHFLEAQQEDKQTAILRI